MDKTHLHAGRHFSLTSFHQCLRTSRKTNFRLIHGCKNNFSKIHISQGAEWTFPSLSYYSSCGKSTLIDSFDKTKFLFRSSPDAASTTVSARIIAYLISHPQFNKFNISYIISQSQNSHHFPNVKFQLTFSLLLPSLLL